MHRLITRTVILATAIFTLILSSVSAAQPRYGDLEALSAYFPKDTMLYASVRTDEATIATLDQFVENATTELPVSMFGQGFPITLTTAIDLITGQSAGGSFEEAIHPWLGDTLAVGMYPAIRSAAGRVVIEVTDTEAAEQAALRVFPDWTSRDVDGYTLLTPTRGDDRNRIAIYDNVLVVYSWSEDTAPQPNPTFDADVSDSPYYADALSRLPEADYDMLAFVDTPLLLAYNERNNNRSEGDWLLLSAVYRIIGSTAFGATVIDEQTIALDIAQTAGNQAGLDALGVQFTGSGNTVDSSLLTVVPRDSFVVVQAADLATMFDVMGGNLQAAAQKFQYALSSIIPGLVYNYSVGMVGMVSGSVVGASNPAWADVVFANLSGFDYTTEIRPLLTGTTTFFMRINPDYNPNSSRFLDWEPFEGAVMFQVADDESAQAFMDKFARELAISIYASEPEGSARFSETTLPGGVRGITLTIYGVSGQPIEEFLIAAQNQLMIMGTRRIVQAVFAGENIGFEAQPTPTLVDSGLTLHVNFPPILSPEWTNLRDSDPGNTLLQQLVYFIGDLTGSAAGNDDAGMVLRTVVTLPCHDDCG